MVLDHIAQHTRALIIGAPPLNSDSLSVGHLYVVDILPSPKRFENTVRESKDQQVLDRFFAQIMVDSINLRFVEIFVDLVVEQSGALKIAAKRLFNNYLYP